MDAAALATAKQAAVEHIKDCVVCGLMADAITSFLLSVKTFETEAHRILSQHETSTSRVVLLDATYKTLTGLSLEQDELFRQGLRCLEQELFRAAHVMAWAGFMDFIENKLASDGLAKIRAARPKWKAGAIDELRDYQGEYQIMEVANDVGLISMNEMKALHGLLNKRNECAHPSSYFPGLNDSLGFIDELLKRIRPLQSLTFK